MINTLKTVTKVRFQDCDPFNHLNNSKYLDYFINTREDQLLENYNIDIYEHLEKTGNGWIISTNQITYVNPALANENILIESKLIKYSKRSLNVEMIMWDKQQNEIKAIYWTQFIYFSIQEKKSVSHSLDIMNLFKEILTPVEQNKFEDRCRYLIRNSRSKLK